MIVFGTPQEQWIAYGLAALLGAIGGIIASLLLRGSAGQLERPRALKNFWDLGFLSEVLIGAAASVAFLWFLEQSTATVDQKAVAAYPTPMFVGASLVVGVSGGAILAAMAERAKALVAQVKVDGTVNGAVQVLEDLKPTGGAADAATQLTTADIDAAIAKVRLVGEQNAVE